MQIRTSRGNIEVSGQNVYKYINKTYACENARIILDNIQELEAIPEISKRSNYVIKGHDLSNFILPEKEENFRLEEWTCKNMVINYPSVDKDCKFFGKLVGYQIPLKVPGLMDKNENEGMGKIDILSVNDETAFILELKVEDSNEHPLRAFLEAYTYWKLLGGNDAKEFLEKSDAKEAKKLEKAVVFYKNSPIHKILDGDKFMNSDVRDLISKLDVHCFLVEDSKSNNNLERTLKKDRITFSNLSGDEFINFKNVKR